MNDWKMENKNQKKEMEKRNNDQKMQHKESKMIIKVLGYVLINLKNSKEELVLSRN